MCRTYAIHAIVGFAEKGGDGRYYIASGLVDDRGEILGIYRKAHLFDQEKQYFSPGSEFKVIDTSFGKIGLMICFDVEFPETARALKLLGADVVIIINANMEPYEEYHRLYARCRAMENEMPVIICNRLGVEGTLIFCGESLVIDAQGTVLLNMEKRKEVGTVTLPLKYQLDPKLSYMANRRTDLYSLLSE